ncbi:MAG: Ig-like domain-containing protein, partial [bacterium]
MSFSHLTTLSLRGRVPLSVMTVADTASVSAGSAAGYWITIANPNDTPATLSPVTDILPDGFYYMQGSTTGTTNADPSVSGQTLTWADPIMAPAFGRVSLRFNVTVSSVPGEYLNRAAADGGTFAVASAGDPARITVTAGEPFALSLDPQRAINIIGTQHTVKATLTLLANAVQDAAILFTVSGVNISSGTRITNAGGQATFTYSGGIPGEDLVSACHDADRNTTCDTGEATATAMKLWAAEHAYSLSLAPLIATNPVGTPHRVTATLTDYDIPVVNATILFGIRGANAASRSQTTDEGGQSSFTYTGTTDGTDTITACYDINGSVTCEANEPSGSASKVWTAVHVFALTLSPLTATNPVGTSHEVTATLTDNGRPVADATILFSVSGANTASGSQATDGDGRASFRYTGMAEGADTITACFDGNDSRACDASEPAGSASKVWTAVQVFALALSPLSDSNAVGTPHTVTATLTDNGRPAADATILFSVSGANTASGSRTTDGSGQATFTYTGTAAGQDTITACHDANVSGT